MRKRAAELIGDNLVVEKVPLTFKLKKGGEEVRITPHAYIPRLWAQIELLLENNDRYVLTTNPVNSLLTHCLDVGGCVGMMADFQMTRCGSRLAGIRVEGHSRWRSKSWMSSIPTQQTTHVCSAFLRPQIVLQTSKSWPIHSRSRSISWSPKCGSENPIDRK